MAKRPGPTGPLIEDICGSNQGLIGAVHHGLHECPALKGFYPSLDLDELLAFAAGSWDMRKYDSGAFLQPSIYGCFSEVYGAGMPWLNRHKAVAQRRARLHQKLNPFSGKRNLRERLELVPKNTVDTLKEQLAAHTLEYLFEVEYHETKQARGGNTRGLVAMSFQNYYPKAGKIVPAFAQEIRRILAAYPRGVRELPSSPQQQVLF